MKITIKRATNFKLKQCHGDFVELNGFQFCLTKNKIDGQLVWFLIELSTGGNVYTLPSSDYNKKEAIKFYTDMVMKESVEDIQASIEKFAKSSQAYYGLPFPINQPVLNEQPTI